MEACTFDEALYFKHKFGKFIGLFATYVDDWLHFRNEEYCKLCDRTEKNSIAKIAHEKVFSLQKFS